MSAGPASRSNRVIILGAGPVGLAAALELTRFGIPSVLVEKHTGTSWHPKTRNFNTRTMEIARGWGAAVYKRLRSIDSPDGWKSPIRFLESATGKEFGFIETHGFEGPGPEVSPALPSMTGSATRGWTTTEPSRASTDWKSPARCWSGRTGTSRGAAAVRMERPARSLAMTCGESSR